MFDVGFWEVSLIGVLALIIIGPERLPGVARSAGKWLGKARRMMTDIKSDIKSELDEAELSELKSIGDDLRGASENFKSQLEAGEKKLQSEGSAMDTAIAGALNKADNDGKAGAKDSKEADPKPASEKQKAGKKKVIKKKTSKATASAKSPAIKKISKKKVVKKKLGKKKASKKVANKSADKTASESTQSA